MLHLQKISTESSGAKPKPKQLSNKPSQKSILAGVVVRKRNASDSIDNKNGKLNSVEVPVKVSKIENKEQTTAVAATSNTEETVDLAAFDKGVLKCIGILPGIGKYRESSDSEKSTDTDDEYDFSDFDWMGRKIKKCKDDDCNE